MRKTRLSLLLALALVLIGLLPVAAQEGNPPPQATPCAIDLSLVEILVAQAGSESDEADVATALRALGYARDEIDAILEDCGIVTAAAGPATAAPPALTSEATPEATAEPAVDLTETLESDFFTLNYPEGWVSESPNPANVFLGNTTESVDLLRQQFPEPAPGEQAILVIANDAVVVTSNNNFERGEVLPLEEVAQPFIDQILGQDGFMVLEQIDTTVAGLPAVEVTFGGGTFEGILIIRHLVSEESGLFALVAGVAAPGEGAAIQPIARAVSESVEWTAEIPEPSVDLPQTYTAENGAFTARYPEGWVTFSPFSYDNGAVVSFGSAPDVQDALETDNPVLSPGQQGASVIVGPASVIVTTLPDADDSRTTLNDLAQAFRTTILESQNFSADSETPTSLNDRRAVQIEFSGRGFAGVAYLIEFGRGQFAGVLGVGAPGELDALRPVVRSIAESVQPDPNFTLATATPFPSPTFVPSPTVEVQAQPITIGDTVEAELISGTSARYTFTGTAGQVISADLDGSFDTTLSLEDASGAFLAYNDDRGDGTLNSRISSVELPADGEYTLTVASYTGSSGGTYTLRLYEGAPDLQATATIISPGTATPVGAAPGIVTATPSAEIFTSTPTATGSATASPTVPPTTSGADANATAVATATSIPTRTGQGSGADVTAEATEVSGAQAELGATFQAVNSFSVDHPSDWQVGEYRLFSAGGGSIVFASSDAALEQFRTSEPRLSEGEQGVQVIVGGASDVFADGDFAPDATLQDLRDYLVDEFIAFQPEYDIQSEGETTINGQPAYVVRFLLNGVHATAYLLETGEDGVFALLLGISTPEEADALEPIILAMAESLVVNPEQ
ncbi:MAG: PPC domain-containing protein [bacterium]|nr:PPC domain-containing protein [bacterium]